MKVALIGFGASGRSTLYRAATRGLAKGDVTAVPVPDPRFDKIVAQVKPKKQTPATVILHDDLDAIQGGGKALSLKWIDNAKKAEILLRSCSELPLAERELTNIVHALRIRQNQQQRPDSKACRLQERPFRSNLRVQGIHRGTTKRPPLPAGTFISAVLAVQCMPRKKG